MSRSYWVSIFAVIGCLVLSGLSSAQTPSSQGVPAVSPTIEKQVAGQAENGEGTTKEFSVPIRIIENPIEANRTKDCDKKSDQHESDDLEAQRKAADAAWKGAIAAERQIDPAWWQVRISSLGTILLIYTLWLTRESLRVTRENGERQLRAYVTVTGSTLEEISDGFMLSAELKNTGQTPAFNMRMMGESFASDYPLRDSKPHQYPLETYGSSVGAGDKFFCAQRLFTDNKELALKAVKEGKIGFWIQGLVIYDDCFKKAHTTKFRFVFGGRLAQSGGVIFHADADGNEAD